MAALVTAVVALWVPMFACGVMFVAACGLVYGHRAWTTRRAARRGNRYLAMVERARGRAS